MKRNKIISLLREGSTEEKAQAASQLGDYHDSEAITLLIEALQIPEWEVYEVAEEALFQAVTQENIDTLIPFLAHDNWFVKTTVIELLGYLQDNKSSPEILRITQDHDEHQDVFFSAIIALGDMEYIQAIPFLLDKLESTDWHTVGHSALALGKIGCDKVTGALLKALRRTFKDTDYSGVFNVLPREHIWARINLWTALCMLNKDHYQKIINIFRHGRTVPTAALLSKIACRSSKARKCEIVRVLRSMLPLEQNEWRKESIQESIDYILS